MAARCEREEILGGVGLVVLMGASLTAVLLGLILYDTLISYLGSILTLAISLTVTAGTLMGLLCAIAYIFDKIEKLPDSRFDTATSVAFVVGFTAVIISIILMFSIA